MMKLTARIIEAATKTGRCDIKKIGTGLKPRVTAGEYILCTLRRNPKPFNDCSMDGLDPI